MLLPRRGNPAVLVLLGATDEFGIPDIHARNTRPSPLGCGRSLSPRRKDLPVFDRDSPRTALVAYEEEKQKLAAFAYAMTKDRDVAEDLVQESFVRLLETLGAGRSPDNVSAWLFRVCTNLAMSRGRRLVVAQRFLRVARPLSDAPPADVELLRSEMNAALLASLATLSIDAQVALLMAAQGFTGREIAKAIGRTELATRGLMFRSRQKLRDHLLLASSPE
jgi:RNA polymerase sigma-70 factor, ECF subfamily